MSRHSSRLAARAGTALLACVAWTLATACDPDRPGPTEPDGLGFEAIISDPINSTDAVTVGSVLDATANDAFVYVSLAPGSLSGANSIEVTNETSGLASIVVPLVDAGFDPALVWASTGDVLRFQPTGGVLPYWREIVPPSHPPIVVRTYPAKGKRDVPVSLRATVVFSEPMDSTVLTSGAVRLLRNGVPIAGRLVWADSARLAVEFQPDQPLADSTTYELVITRASLDLDGESIAVEERIPFVTGADETPNASDLRLAGVPPVAVVGQRFLPRVVLAAEHPPAWFSDARVTWTSSDTGVATVGLGQTSSIELHVIGEGTVTITANVEGLSITHVLEAVAEPALSGGLSIESASLVEFAPAHDADARGYAPLVTLRDATGKGARVFSFTLRVPGVGDFYCTALRNVEANQTIDLVREIYGDYELTFDRPGGRATLGDATLAVYFFDGDGHTGKALSSMPVVPGPQYPSTYTGGFLRDPWDCDYSRLIDPMFYQYANAPLSDELTVVEFAVRGDAGSSYVPEMTLRTSGSSSVEVVAVDVAIPGIDAPTFCRTHRTVVPGEDFRLFRVAYGDYEWAVTGEADAEAIATITVYFVGAGGSYGKVVATSSITPGVPVDPLASDPHPEGWACGPNPFGA